MVIKGNISVTPVQLYEILTIPVYQSLAEPIISNNCLLLMKLQFFYRPEQS